MTKRGKVGCGGQKIMRDLYGDRGRPETNQWAALCAEQIVRQHDARSASLRPLVTYMPDPHTGHLVETSSRLVESPRTSNKWAAARARHRNQETE